MPKQGAQAPEPLSIGHSALGGFTVGPEAVQEAGGGLDHLEGQTVTVVTPDAAEQKPEPLRPIDPKGDGLKPGTKIE